MLKLFYDFLWDPAAARAGIVFAGSVLGGYLLQPVGRTWYDRLIWAAAAAIAPTVASAPSAKKRRRRLR